MAANYYKINYGFNLQPVVSSVSVQGDIDYNSSTNQLEVYTTQVESITTNLNTQTLSNKTLNASTNTITNIVNANISATAAIAVSKFASGTAYQVLVTDSTGAITEWGSVSLAQSSAVNGVLGYANGGTDAASQAAAQITMSPMTTLGDITYENSTPAPTRLAGNTSTTNKFLTQAGNGTISAAPAWNTIQTTDVPNINLAASGNGGVTGTLTVPNGGTGIATTTAYAVLTAGTTATGAFQQVSGVGTSGQVLTSQGASSLPIWSSTSAFAVPSGSMIMYGSDTPPSGWLTCNGAVVSQTTYANLYAILSTSYNTGGEGAGNFRLPDLRGIFPVGSGGNNGQIHTLAGGNYGGNLGTYSQDTFQQHAHASSATASSSSSLSGAATGNLYTDTSSSFLVGTATPGGSTAFANPSGSSSVTGTVTTTTTVTPTVAQPTTYAGNTVSTGAITQPASLGVSFIIKT